MLRALAFALALCGSAAGATGYDGTYRPDADWATGWDCRTVGMDGGALAIRDGTYYGVESACALENPVAVRDMDATLYDMSCQGEGERWTSRVMLMSTPEGVVVVRDGGNIARLIRCD